MRKDKNALLTYKKIIDILSRNNFQNVVDIGCGDTDLLTKIRKITLNNNSLLKSYFGIGYEVLEKDETINVIKNLDFNKSNWDKSITNKFDILLIIDVIEHLENPFLFLNQIKTLSRKNSKILLTVPNIHSYRSRIKFLLTGKPSAFFDKKFNKSSIRNFDDHIWLPAIDLIKYYLRCHNYELLNIHHIYGNNIFTSHTILFEARVR